MSLKRLFLATIFLSAAFFFANRADAAPPVISAVASSTGQTHAVITWTTDQAASSTVYYGTTTAYGFASTSDSLVFGHSLIIRGLIASTTYHFKVLSTNASAETSSSSDRSLLTKANLFGLNAAKVVWLKKDRFRAVYDWTGSSQLNDWNLTRGASLTRGTSTVAINSGSGSVHAMIWKQPMAVSRIMARAREGGSAHINIYSNLSSYWDGTPYAPNPALGHVWCGWSFWVDDGNTDESDAPSPGYSSTWYDYELQASTTKLRSWSSNDGIWREQAGAYAPTTTGLTALGAYSTGSYYGQVSIEGRIAQVSSLTGISSTTYPDSAVITFATNASATSTVEYGTTTAYGSASSSDVFNLSSHSIRLKNLTKDALYHFRITATDRSGQSFTSADYTFTPQDDVLSPVISDIIPFTGPTSTIVTWTTDELSSSTVEYGPTAAYGSASSSDLMSSSHSIGIRGLSNLSTYHFRVISTDQFGNTRASDDQVLFTRGTLNWLHPASMGWISSTTFRANYDWTDDDQLLDWTPTTNASFSRGTSTIVINDGSTDVDAVIWKQPLAVSRMRARANPFDTGHINFYSNLSSSWNGGIYNPNPSLGNVWRTSDSFFSVNGSTYNYSGPNVGSYVWRDYELRISSTTLRSWMSLDGSWHERNGSYLPSFSGIATFGAHGGGHSYGALTIEGSFSNVRDISAVSASALESSATITFETDAPARILVEYGTTTAYGLASSSDAYTVSHSVGLKDLSAGVLYHFKITAIDPYGNSTSTADFSFQPGFDATAPVISSIVSLFTATSAIITWTTDEPASSTVEYGLTAAYGSASSSDALASEHSIYLRGLEPFAMHHFRVRSSDARGNEAVSSDLYFKTNVFPLDIKAAQSGWISTTTIRAVYDWSSAAQLDDWTPTTGSTFTRGTSTVLISDGSGSINAMIWDQPIAVSKIFARASAGSSSHINFYSNLSSSWTGSPYDPNPALGHVWCSWSFWVVNGSTYDSGSPNPGTGNWYDYEFQASTAKLRSWTSLDNAWHERAGAYAPDTAGIMAVGAYSSSNTYGRVVIDGQVDTAPDLAPPVISSISSTTTYSSATMTWTTNELASSTVKYGPTSAYGQASSSERFATGHSLALRGLTASTTYHFKIFSEDYSGNSTSSADMIFRTASDVAAPTVSAFVVPSSVSSLTVGISSFTADDNVGVSGYLITESASAPSSGDPGWSASVPSSYIFSSAGEKILYAWAKDSAGNISSSLSASLVIEIGRPALMARKSSSQPLPSLLPAAETPAPAAIDDLFGADRETVEEVTAQEAKNLLDDPGPVSLSEIENKIYLKIIALAAAPLSEKDKLVLARFVHGGTPTTAVLGAGERGGVVASFASAFGRLPSSLADWQDAIKIANGRWPKMESQKAVKRAQASFLYIYEREADLGDPNDNAAVTIMAYGLRPAKRNIGSERGALRIYESIFNRSPWRAASWDAVRAIAYSGAKR